MENEPLWQARFFGEEPKDSIPLIIIPVADEPGLTLDSQYRRLFPDVKEGMLPPFMLAAFEVESWNDDLSPWPAAGIGRGQPPFQGNGDRTLAWVTQSLIPAIEEDTPFVRGGKRGLLGYSMGGLFTLWALHQTIAFDAFLSCSGSLWYDGFTDYFVKKTVEKPCWVYLSQGEKEEQTRNQRFASVGKAARESAAYLEKEPMVHHTALVWHPGGHGNDGAGRIGVAIRWMLKE